MQRVLMLVCTYFVSISVFEVHLLWAHHKCTNSTHVHMARSVGELHNPHIFLFYGKKHTIGMLVQQVNG